MLPDWREHPLAAILDAVPEAITVQDKSGRVVHANAAAAQLLGFASVEALLNAPQETILSRFEIFDRDGNPFPVSGLPGRLALQGEPTGEITLKFRDLTTNEERWSSVRAMPVLNEQGEVLFAVNTVREITLRKRVEEKLIEQREWLKVTLESIGDGVIVTDTHGRITFMNAVAEALTGWSQAEALGQEIETVFRIVNETTRQPVAIPLMEALRHGQIIGMANHTVLIRKDGREIAINDSGAPIYDHTETLIGAVLVFRDITEERSAQRAIEASETRFRTLADSAPVLIWMSDTAKNCVYFNRPWLEFTGRSAEQEQGFGWFEGLHPDDAERCLKTYTEAFDARKPFEMDYRLRHHSGEYRWVTDRGVPLYDSDGIFTGYIGSCIDVSERKQQELAMSFLNQAGMVLVSSIDYETTLRHVADLAVPRIADWCTIDLLDENNQLRLVAISHIDPEKVKWAHELRERYPIDMDLPYGVPQVLRTGQPDYLPYISDEMLVAAAGNDEEALRILRLVGYRSALSVPLTARGRTFGAITFVTTSESGRFIKEHELTMAQELAQRASLAVDNAKLYKEVQEHREQLRVTLASIGDAVIVTDTQGAVTFLNAVAEDLTGWMLDDAAGRPLTEIFRIVNETTRNIVESPVDKVLREGTIVGLANHTILISRDGREIPIDDSGAPVRDNEGNLIGVVLVFRDISERKAFEVQQEQMLQQERRAREQAEIANNLKLQFLAMISHELRTPLASIKGFASSLLAEDVSFDPEEQREFLHILDQEADKLKALIEQLLDVSQLQAGTLRVDPQRKSLEEILSTAEAQLRVLTANHRLELNVPPLPPVLADVVRISQVIINLIDNATKYAPVATRIELRAVQKDNHILINVIDEGPGIAPEEREQVFETFRQADRKSRMRGAGLGLAICKGLIEAHGGRIWIEDHDGPGACIAFTLPLADSNTTTEVQ